MTGAAAHAADRRALLRRCAAGLAASGLPGVLAPRLARAATTPAPPEEVRAALPEAALRGQGLLRFLGLAVYEIRLWVAPGFDARAPERMPLALEIAYRRSLDGARIAERSLDEMRRGGAIADDAARRWLAAMTAAFPDVRDGDRITGVQDPAGSARFWVNGRAVARIDDAEFTRRFFGIWLAPHTSEPGLRAALLGDEARP